ncbi:hypothetical protein O0I10_001586 [Lichtheimia ornata]|uniref:Major facilitator superfamily (MFS) profile domain-containing protein n=1 Tax=Lichtheimia ornata TaxID=688661 RepID=A0AAD7VBI6_9FUNG|nr:uncharacterized protein O0I10_001586 [Lichtheimia ornata]KAJ8662624.1 hypothetical protein O0I10_001586 [Lichtheimia ornata]
MMVTERGGKQPSSRTLLRGNAFLYSVAAFAALGQFLFGYDQGVMSGVLVNQRWLELFHYPDAVMKGLVVAIFELGALVTSVIAGWAIDHFGRVGTIRIGAFVFIIGGTLQTAANHIALLLVGRLVAGFGVGFFSTVIPIYSAELGRAENRGVVAVFSMSIILVGLAASGSPSNIISISPTLFIIHDKEHDHPDVVRDHDQILDAVKFEETLGKMTWRDMFVVYKRRSWIAIIVQTCAQLQGMNVINYYAPIIYQKVLGPGKLVLLMNGVTATIFVFGAWTCMLLVERCGRRPLFLATSLNLALWLILMAIFTSGIVSDTRASSIMTIVCAMVFIFTVGLAWGPVAWLYVAEIFPLRARAKGVALSTISHWLWNFAVGLWTPPLLESIGWVTYLLYAAMCIATFIIVYFTFLETKGKTLEEIETLFGDNNQHARQLIHSGIGSNNKPPST